jgi:hypothetical protein
MTDRSGFAPNRRARSVSTTARAGAVAVAALTLLLPAATYAAIMRFGSELRGRATLTTNNLKYRGVNTPYGGRIIHTAHFGADTALWNTIVSGGRATAPAAGQVTEVQLKGCAIRARRGPVPLRQIHFQTLAPRGGGAVKVELTSQPFDIPVCGAHKEGTNMVSTYKPQGLCIDTGDYVGFNDEGGFVERFYRAGVPYNVIAASRGSRLDSFIMGGGTGNGAVMRPSVIAPADGFASSTHEELLLRATLATGQNATSGCRHGIPR